MRFGLQSFVLRFLFKKIYFENWRFVWGKMVFKWLFELMYVKQGLLVFTFLKLFLQKIWRVSKLSIPLHSLLRNRRPAYNVQSDKEEFFEKIYINREVVQEASVWFYIKWMGKRNEPINSLSLLLRHRLKTKGTKEKVLFT